MSPAGPHFMLMGRKFLSPDTMKSSPRLAVNVEPLGFRMFCLIEQPFVKDQKTTIKALVDGLGGNAQVRRFARVKIGEE